MRKASEFAIELQFEKRSDGRYHVHSPSVAGLHLAGMDLTALCADVEPAIKHLLKHNAKIDADQVRWVPTLDEIQHQFKQPAQGDGKATYVVKFKAA
jgi:predicted RNase H-like HicB family nuclease